VVNATPTIATGKNHRKIERRGVIAASC